MKKFFVIFALFCAVFLISCGSDSDNETAEQPDGNSDTVTDNESESPDSSSQDAGKTDAEETPSDNDSDAAEPQRNEGELYGECYPNNTCNEGLVCDTENNICIKDKSSGKDDSDSGDSTDDKDAGEDKNDAEPQPDEDSGDPQPDEDSGNENDDDGNGSDDDTDTATDTEEAEKCAEAGGNWNATKKECTKTADCPDKPANSVWNDGKEGDEIGKFTQTLADSGWNPTDNSSVYSLNPGECRYKCTENFVWNQMQCKKPLTIGNICTGHTKCYNASKELEECPASASGSGSSYNFYGQDAQYLDKCIAQSFTLGTESLEGTVFDNNTLLTWEQSPSENTYTWENAHEHCDDLNNSNDGEGFAGIKTWRVPNPLEFLTIVDNSTHKPATNSYFMNMPITIGLYFLWTSKEHGGNTSEARVFDTYHGGGYPSGKSKNSSFRILCVSGNELVSSTSSDFITSSDGKTVTDTRTGLMWQKEYATDKTWQQALAYCQSLNTGTEPYAGYTGWRLPNKNELASLLDPGRSGTPYSKFPDMPSNVFWSSSTNDGSENDGWVVNFNSGVVGHNGSKSREYKVRCVRKCGIECNN